MFLSVNYFGNLFPFFASIEVKGPYQYWEVKNMEDQELIALYWNREESALTETEEKYGPYCYAIAWNLLGDQQDSEECVSDTWLRAWQSIPPQRPLRLSLFLGKITRNLSLDRLRKRRAEKRGNGQGEVLLEELAECLPPPVVSAKLRKIGSWLVPSTGSCINSPPGTAMCFWRGTGTDIR